MGCFTSMMGAGADAVAKQKALLEMKKGKTEEQKQVIDFFLADYAKKGCGCLNFKSKAMTIEEYNARVENHVRSLNFRERAKAKLGLDDSEIQEIAPIFLYDYDYDLDDDELFWKFKDNVVVTSKYSVTYLFFTSKQLLAYTYDFDMTSDTVSEYMKEVYYQDITSFEIENDLIENIEKNLVAGCLKGGKGCINTEGKGCFNKENVVKNNYTRTYFRVAYAGGQFSIGMDGTGHQVRSLMAAKNKLRDKKFEKNS